MKLRNIFIIPSAFYIPMLAELKDTFTNCGMPMAITQAMIPFAITQPDVDCLAEDVDGAGFSN